MKNDIIKKNVSQQIARIIKEARKAKGWTKYKLSEESGVTCGHLHRIEAGRLAVRTDVLQKICGALNISVQFPLPV